MKALTEHQEEVDVAPRAGRRILVAHVQFPNPDTQSEEQWQHYSGFALQLIGGLPRNTLLCQSMAPPIQLEDLADFFIICCQMGSRGEFTKA